MISEAVIDGLTRFVGREQIHLNEPMSTHTTFRTGGTADCLVELRDTKQLMEVKRYLKLVEVPIFVLGNGSNLLVSDEGYRGVILQVGGCMKDIRVEGDLLIAQAGASLAAIAQAAMQNGLTGLEFASGIPGTVGGGVVMNAGAYGGEMSQVVRKVTVVTRDGELLELENETMEFGYRHSSIRNHPFVVTEVEFCLEEGDLKEIQTKMQDLNQRRREKQPLEYASAGSTFKRPEGYYAGELIMNAGLRGVCIGDAQVSEKHCGFIINRGHAKATEIMQLIRRVQYVVDEKFHVQLEPEVIFLGEF